MSGDNIMNLPTDKMSPSANEVNMMNTFFQENKGTFHNLCYEFKDILVIGLIYFLVGLPFVDGLIKSMITSAENSSFILLGIKTLLFMLVYFIVTNWKFARKS